MTRIAVLSADGMVNAPLAVTLDMIHAVRTLAPATALTAHLYGTSPAQPADLALPGIEPLEAALGSAFDAVVIPGLGHAYVQSPSALVSTRTGDILRQIAGDCHQSGGVVAASCTGTFVLAGAGLLEGGIATTSWWLAPQFRQAFPNVMLDERQLVCEHDRVLTGGGALAHVELMQTLLRRFAGATVVEAVAGYIVSPRRGPQSAQSSVTQIAIADPVVAGFVHHVASRLDQAIPLAEIAAVLSTTPRTLERRVRQQFGATPTGLVQRIRAEAAMHLLRTTRLPLKTICQQVGYQDENSLRQLLLRLTGLTPRAIRTLG